MAEVSVINSNKVILKVTPVAKTARIILSVLIIIGFILPIVVVAFVAGIGEEIKATVLISFVLFWGAGFFLFRMLSWNTSGQETLTIKQDSATLTSKSNRFSFNDKAIKADNIVFSAMPSRIRWIDGQEVQTGKLMIVNLDDMSQSVTSDVELPMSELKSLLSTLNNRSVGKRQLGDGETEF